MPAEPTPPDSYALRGCIVSFDAEDDTPTVFDDGAVVVSRGRIAAVGPAALLDAHPGIETLDHRGRLILPGFIDTHAHYVQTQVIGSYGKQLLDWLGGYVFPEEARAADPAHAATLAGFFLDELLRNGTTSVCAYSSVHAAAADALFAAAASRGMRLISGKTMMDRNAPPELCDTAQTGAAESVALLSRWHGQGRAGYAITPRFAITSTPAQLEASAALVRAHPECWVQTHLSENHAEIATACGLYPEARDYTDIYDRHGLLTERTLLGHCIHLSDRELDVIARRRSVAVFCPTSNLFLGSGLFDLARMRAAGVRLSLATDIGGGTDYSMLRTAAEAYKILQLQGQSWPARAAFRLMTRGNAEALGLAGEIGRIAPGLAADLVVLDPRATPAMAHRADRPMRDLDETLFMLMTMGDDRAVAETIVGGRRVARH
ncbi:guanine deaminase [Endobacter medicaginis]|jgi:guanine deaminase|uniref:Guanine deaminase n=1 Tax=Endobacter medicaginis TaxID=1181271 RepID=A0A850NRE1_9PROT|nr:guanine deaminase [Endobacter medicaginis]MBB3173476.1 guanine deaminase [Endobacter medicaginis]MCX5475489.1 guanine deaminase [Endobacter medicaginis]NVN30740.1 guanine deaminase [Endobacter medicaginis]